MPMMQLLLVAQLKAAYTDLEGTIKTTDTKISDTYTKSAIDSKISTVESKITAPQTKYFSINPSSDTLTANVNSDGASTSGAADAMAIGPNATATSAKAVAIGNNVSASGKGSIALGTADNPVTSTTVTAGDNTSANPHVTSAEGANSVAVGTSAIAQTDNSVALGTRASVYTSNVTDSTTLTNAETAAVDVLDTTGMTDTDKATAQAEAKEKARYATNLAAMKKSGTAAGLQTFNTDTTYDDGTSYTYAGSSPAGVVTVGSVGAERRIQNVAAGLVSASSTDAVNGSQLYALTRQIRFGGDNSSFGTTTVDDKNVVARGSNETIAITGGSDTVTASTTDGNTTYTVDTTKLTDNNIAVVADTDKEALHVQLASNLKNLNTAQLGSGSGDSYKASSWTAPAQMAAR